MKGTLHDSIYQILAARRDKEEAKIARQEIDGMNLAELMVWLGEQDNSVRYHLALDLDIPLQHLEHTCETMKRVAVLA